MSNSIKDKSSYCTGCGVCANICPKDAINISLNKKGFYEADVNDDLCISCGACKKVCYKFIYENNSKETIHISEVKAFKAYSKNDEIRYNSSSGGIGSEFTSFGLRNNYLICGVAYNYDLQRAEHIFIDKKEDLYKIMGSKYIQSFTKEAFDKFKKDEKYIVFGTPCQIYGLRKYFELKQFKEVILIDFFCHGIPSYNLWRKYLKYIKEKYGVVNISKINFREKSTGWHTYSMHICSSNNMYRKIKDKDKFLKFFLSNNCLNESCFECKLRFDKLYSDIRIGDFWGDLCKDDKKGVSILLINSEKGKEIIKKIKDNIYLEEVKHEDVKRSQYIPYVKKPNTYYEFEKDLQENKDLQQLYKKYLLKTDMKIFIKKSIKKIIGKNS